MKVLVIGATGTIGKGIIQVLQQEGLEVISASRNSDFSVDIENAETIENLFKKVGPIDVVICTAGGASFGKLSDLSDQDLTYSANSKLLGQLRVAKAALPYLNPEGTIILTGGLLAYKPWPGTSSIAMINAAIEGFTKAMAKELPVGKRILVVHPPHVAETAKAKGMDASNCPSALEVARTYLQSIKSSNTGEPVFVGKYVP